MSRFQAPRAGLGLTAAALVLLCAVAVTPLLNGVMPETADGTLHLYRLVALDHALQDGTLWPRYVPSLVYGYGSPMFNFYSPLSLYPMLALNLFGVSYVQSWLIGMVLYVIAAAGGAYLLGRVWGGGAVGVAAAAAYVYSPYFLYDVLWRGTVSETATLALLPWVLWAIKALADTPSRRSFLAVIASTALFIPMHNVITLHGAALIALYALFVCLTARDWLRAGMRVFGALALAALMTAFFWYPAVRETPNVKIDAITASLPEIDVTRNLTSPLESLRPPYPADPTRQQPPSAVALGWPQLLLALVGLFALRSQSRRVQVMVVLCAVGVVFFVFMTTPPSASIWQAVPLIRYSQFPTRLLGPASLLLAVMAGYGVAALAATRMRLNGKLIAVSVPVLVLILYTLPVLSRTPLPEIDPRSVADALDFERESGFVGTSSFGEYVPVWNTLPPDPDLLRGLYDQHTVIPRLLPAEGVTVEDSQWRHTSGELVYTASEDTTLTFAWFYLPYWRAETESGQLDVAPSENEGLVQVLVPEGEHTLRVWLAPSRTQGIAGLVSLAAFAATAGILALWPLLRGKPAVEYVLRFEAARDARRALIAAALAGIIGLGAKAVFDLVPNPYHTERFAEGYAAGVQTVIDANFGREITLIGVDLPLEPVRGGDEAEFSLYWMPRAAEIMRDYSVVLILKTTDGLEVTRALDWQPGGVETHHWRYGQYVKQTIRLPVPADTMPGSYTVSVSLFEPDNNSSLEVINAAGDPEGVEVSLGMIEVSRGETLPVSNADVHGTIGSLNVLDVSGVPDQVTVGQGIDLALRVRATANSPDSALRFVWHSPDTGNITQGQTLSSSYPFSAWGAGDVWTIHQRVYVPPGADERIILQIQAADGDLTLVEFDVTVPDRIFDVPVGVMPDGTEWENGIALVGYIEGDASIVLFWTNDTPLTTELRRFAHVIDGNGRIVQVVDGVPADWSRPVTGWLPGEVIEDRVQLAVLEGQTLRLGWYDPQTNQRASVSGQNADYADVLSR